MNNSNQSAIPSVQPQGWWCLNRSFPFLVTGVLALGTLWMWQSLLAQDRIQIHQRVEGELGKVTLTITKAYDLQVSAFIRMAERGESEGGITQTEWEMDARHYLRDFPGFQSLHWVDHEKNLQWDQYQQGSPLSQKGVSGEKPGETVAGNFSLNLEKAELGHPVGVIREGNFFDLMVPMESQIGTKGYIVGRFHLDDWLQELLHPFPTEHFGLTFHDGKENLFGLGLPPSPLVEKWAEEASVQLGHIPFYVKVFPTPTYLQEVQSQFPPVAFVIGLGVSLLFGLIIGVTQVARRRQLSLGEMNTALEKENAERTKVQNELTQSEQQFRFAFEDGPLGMALVRSDFSFITVNKALCRMLGYSEAELMGRSFIEVTDPQDVDKCRESAKKAFEGECQDFSLEKRCVTKQGEVVWINLRASLVTLPQGTSPYLLTLVEDITARKLMEKLQVLQTAVMEKTIQNRPLQEVLDALCLQIEQIIHPSLCTVMLVDPEQGVLNLKAAPSAPETLCGFLTNLIPGEKAGSCGTAVFTKTPVIVTDTETDPRWEPFRDLAKTYGVKACWSIPIFSQGQTVMGTFAISHPHSRQPTELNLKVLETASYLAGVVIQHREAVEELQTSEDRYRDLFQAAPLAYLTTTIEGSILSVNGRTVEILGYTPDEFMGRSVMEFFAPTVDGQEKAQELYSLAHEQTTIQGQNVALQRKDGSYLWINMAVRVITDAKGDPIERREIWEDVTAKRQTENLLTAQKVILELIARGHSLSAILGQLCILMEKQSVGMLCSVHVLKGEVLHFKAGPSLPDSYREKVRQVIIGPNVGSCGTAAYRNESVCVTDISSDPLWENFSDLALSHGFRACWSVPICSSKGLVLGTFAIYSQKTRQPSWEDEQLMEIATNLAGIAIERWQGLDALERSEERYRVLYEDNPTMYFTVSPTGTVLSVNQFGASQLGYSVDELVGGSVLKILHPDDRENAWANLEGLFLKPNDVQHWEFRKVRKDGSILWVKETARVIGLSEISPVVLIVCEDIALRKEAERALQERIAFAALDVEITQIVMRGDGLPKILQSCAERILPALNVTLMGIWMMDETEQALDLQASVGFSAERKQVFDRIAIGDFLVGQIVQKRKSILTNSLQEDHHIPESEWAIQEGWVGFAGYPLILHERVLGVLAVFSDHSVTATTLSALEMVAARITLGIEKTRAEQAQRVSEGRLQALLDHSSAVIYMKDLEGRYLLINRTYERICQLDRENIQGKTDFDIFPTEIAKALVANDQMARFSGPSFEKEEILPHEDGLHTYLSNKFPLVGPDGARYAVCTISTDITFRKQTEEALQFSEQRLRGLLEERTKISQDLHDHILQSLYAVGLIIAAAKQPIKINASSEALGHLEQAIAQLNTAIGEIRGFIEGMPREPMEVGDFSTELYALVRAITLPLSTKFDVYLDHAAVQRLNKDQTLHLLNIAREAMSNCIRHAQATRGGIRLTSEGEAIRFEIYDNGMGFERNGGSSLGHGLSNMQSRVNQMNGKFTIQSQRGKGTHIIVELLETKDHYETIT